MTKYSIGEVIFNTKKECLNYTRNIINKLGCCIIDKNNPNFIFFNNLFKNHPNYNEKVGVGIDYIFIQHNYLNRKTYETMIKRLDGSEIDISWVYCCNFKERTVENDLKKAMRQAVKDITIYFKEHNQLICNFCKTENEPYENYHTDHHNPSFITLINNFLQSTSLPIPSSFADCKKSNTTIFKDDDEDFKNEWILYHNSNCKLQILCKNCNLKKGKKDIY